MINLEHLKRLCGD